MPSATSLYDGVKTGSQDGSPLAPLMGRFTEFDGGVTSVHLGGTSFLVCYPDHGIDLPTSFRRGRKPARWS